MNIAETANRPVVLELTLLQVMVIHGNMCLGLRHPGNQGASTEIARDILQRLGQALVEGSLLTAEELRHAQQIEVSETKRTMRQ